MASFVLKQILAKFGISLPSHTRPIHITTEHNRTFTYELEINAKISDVKRRVFNAYGLSPCDQYYNTPQNPTILEDKDKVFDKVLDTLHLRTDEYLNLDELKNEKKKLTKITKVFSDPFSVIGASVVTAASQRGTNSQAAPPNVDDIVECRNELRRLKVADGRSAGTKKTFKGHSGAITDVAHVAKNIFDLGRDAADGASRKEIDVTRMTEAYGRIGN